MLPDKQVKKKFKKVFSEEPDKYYATSVLKSQGFKRGTCKKCGTNFWSVEARDVCGDPSCSGGFTFLSNNPAKNKMDYVQVWKKFSEFMKQKGYTPIDRYSVVARWRDDTDFVQASIYDFQPYVVNGEVEPPANPLVVPQFSLRFNDIDNVGVTMSHNTGFVMIGQHAFMKKENWNQEKYFKDLVEWFLDGVGLDKKELVFHEDAWAGGGNFGPCMEIFSRGVELANQVYMLYEQTPEGDQELKLKVLDMGMGHERVAWFSQGKGTMYDAAFPVVVKKLIERTKVEYDQNFINKYLPYGSYLNIDETEDVAGTWGFVAEKLDMNIDVLRKKLLPLSAMYSVAEHSRSLLVAISDGALPSNVKGGYNLRVILRRALQFIDEYDWNLELSEVCEWHAEYLKPIFPELSKNLDHVKKILQVEKKKYLEGQERNKKIIEKIIQKDVSVQKLVELYDSHGISPETVRKEAKKLGKVIVIPDNFYALVSEKHEQSEQKTQTVREEKLDLDGMNPTKILYFDHFDLVDFKAHVIKMLPTKNPETKYVLLEQTAFYPTSGGQIHDLGTMNGCEVVDVLKQGSIIIHEIKNPNFKEKDSVLCKIDFDRRLQLAQHHTATHILTGSARRILGDHVWQAGAAKTVEKSRLDITHYEQLTENEIKKIEELANTVVKENRPVFKSFMKRNLAEARYGVRIYQGGAVPGKELRIVNINDFDVEACGGTHLDITGDVGSIKIIKTSKIQDGVVRLEFLAGSASEKQFEKEREIIRQAKEILSCEEKQIPARAQELFENWKKAKKGKLDSTNLTSKEEYSGDIIQKTADILKTQPEHIIKTLQRFRNEIN